jgi:hypothetical protein
MQRSSEHQPEPEAPELQPLFEWISSLQKGSTLTEPLLLATLHSGAVDLWAARNPDQVPSLVDLFLSVDSPAVRTEAGLLIFSLSRGDVPRATSAWAQLVELDRDAAGEAYIQIENALVAKESRLWSNERATAQMISFHSEIMSQAI